MTPMNASGGQRGNFLEKVSSLDSPSKTFKELRVGREKFWVEEQNGISFWGLMLAAKDKSILG